MKWAVKRAIGSQPLKVLGSGRESCSRRQRGDMVVVEEMWTVLHDRKPFDRARFIPTPGKQ